MGIGLWAMGYGHTSPRLRTAIGLEFRVRSQFLPVLGIDRICESYDPIYDRSAVNNPADFWQFVHRK